MIPTGASVSAVNIKTTANRVPALVAPGLFAPPEFTARVSGEPPLDVDLLIRVADGRFVCAELTARQQANGPAVSAETLRRVPVATLVRESVRIVAMPAMVDEAQQVTTIEPVEQGDGKRLAAAGPTDETLAFVAFTYQLAYALGDGPTRAVQEQLGLPRSTAGRWIEKARKRGLLSASTGQGRTGGPDPLSPQERQDLLEAFRHVPATEDIDEVRARVMSWYAARGRSDLMVALDDLARSEESH